MKEENIPIEDAFTDIYRNGFRNGAKSMKNEILKNINRDWKLLTVNNNLKLLTTLLDKIEKIKVKSTI